MRSAGFRRLLCRNIDRLTELLIYFGILFGPWAFGTTRQWSIDVMNGVGFAAGTLLLLKILLRFGGDNASLAWSAHGAGPSSQRAARAERRFTSLLAVSTIAIVLFCFLSAWNARAIYHTDQWNFEYRDAITWLPHSYDQDSSWLAFWEYLGLAGFFWALRDWLMTLSPEEADRYELEGLPDRATARLPVRLRRLFWVLTINGTLLAIEALIQRAEGGNKLLWLVVPRINKSPTEQFGPYAYRGNAAQYFNLLWPAVLGFWWACVRSARRRRGGANPRRGNLPAVLLPCIFIMAVCPLVSSSRGGAIVLVINLLMAAVILFAAQWRSHWTAKVVLVLVLGGAIGGGALLGWQTLAPRMEMIKQGYAAREGLYLAGNYMAQDNAVFGTGPGTFETMYQLYRRSETDEWLGYMHNDWLQTLITFGRVGAAPIFLCLALALSHWFWGGGINANKYFVMLLWVSLGGCLAHAWFDFPFQIHSVLALFLVLCAVLSCLTRRSLAS
jgi:O-antigen ligase